MREYYRAPIKKITATNPVSVSEKYYTYDKKIEILDDKLFYYNTFNVLIEAETKFPMFRDSELDDLIQSGFSSESKPKEVSFIYVDTNNLRYVNTERKASKILKKIKR